MKALSLCLLLLCALATPSLAQKKDKGSKNSDEDSEVAEYSRREDPSRNRQESCSCRGVQGQVDILEARLDKMIDLWNDFVDNNRSPYEQPYPGGNRRPRPSPAGGSGRMPSYYSPDMRGRMPPSSMDRRGSDRFYGYDGRDDDFDRGTGGRRIRF